MTKKRNARVVPRPLPSTETMSVSVWEVQPAEGRYVNVIVKHKDGGSIRYRVKRDPIPLAH